MRVKSFGIFPSSMLFSIGSIASRDWPKCVFPCCRRKNVSIVLVIRRKFFDTYLWGTYKRRIRYRRNSSGYLVAFYILRDVLFFYISLYRIGYCHYSLFLRNGLSYGYIRSLNCPILLSCRDTELLTDCRKIHHRKCWYSDNRRNPIFGYYARTGYYLGRVIG